MYYKLKILKKKTNPKKIPKRLYIKLKTNIERFKRVNFNQKMIYPNSAGENYLYFMKYYPLQKSTLMTILNQIVFSCSFQKQILLEQQ